MWSEFCLRRSISIEFPRKNALLLLKLSEFANSTVKTTLQSVKFLTQTGKAYLYSFLVTIWFEFLEQT